MKETNTGNISKPKHSNEPDFILSHGDSIYMNSKVRKSLLNFNIFHNNFNHAILYCFTKCCYFVRQGDSVDVTQSNDTSLLYGEITESPLKTFQTFLSSTYMPLFTASNEWGKANEEQKQEFKMEINRFLQNINGAIQSLSHGLELRSPSAEQIQFYDSMNTRNFSKQIHQNPDVIPYFEELLEEWCDQIEVYLDTPDNIVAEGSSHSSSKTLITDEGPRGELSYWHDRMQHLTSITEQIKRKDCKNVIGLLSALTKIQRINQKQKCFFSYVDGNKSILV